MVWWYGIDTVSLYIKYIITLVLENDQGTTVHAMHAVKGGWLFFGAAYAWMMMMTPLSFLFCFASVFPDSHSVRGRREVEGGVVSSLFYLGTLFIQSHFSSNLVEYSKEVIARYLLPHRIPVYPSVPPPHPEFKRP
jgi:hypothetical protein